MLSRIGLSRCLSLIQINGLKNTATESERVPSPPLVPKPLVLRFLTGPLSLIRLLTRPLVRILLTLLLLGLLARMLFVGHDALLNSREHAKRLPRIRC